MSRQITDQTFFKYLKCPSWVYFDATEAANPHDPLVLRLINDGLMPDKEREIINDRPDVAEVTAEDPEEAFRQTLAFMREGRETIYHGMLVHGHWVGNPDLLVRVEGQSQFGNYYYVAGDIKRARELREEHQMQGCFYAELLERVQGRKPVQGYVLTPDKAALSYLIESFEAEYHLTLTEIERIVAGEKPQHFLTSACKQSPWFGVCRSETESCDDLSVLNRVWREEVAALEAAGVKTIAQLTATPVAELERLVPGVRPFRFELLRDQAIALRDDRHLIRESVSFPAAKLELYFDIESDPLRDFDYLFGVLEVEKGKATYHSFFAEMPEKEGKMWRAFCDFMESRFDAPIYHYGAFEGEVVRRFSAKYGVSPLVGEAFERNLIDLLALIRPAIVFPLSFYSLKDLASYAGFSWRGEEPSGVNAVIWFEEWFATRKKTVMKKILEYNEDDVRATWTLKEWVAKEAK